MTAVQWWCSGVMLDSIFRPSQAPARRYDDLPLPEMLAAAQGQDNLAASRESDALIGTLLDQVA